MTQSALKLSYFDTKGRAESIRLALSIGNIEFEDNRVTGEEFAKMKPSLPVGSLPILHVDGQTICQTGAIFRYVGDLTGLYPKNAFDRLLIDQVIETNGDLVKQLVPLFVEKDKAKRLVLGETLVNEHFPRYLGGMNSFIEGEYVLGDKISLADIVIYNIYETLVSGTIDVIPTDSLNKYPKVAAVAKKIKSHPAVVKWEQDHA